jgi:hypothetical protein
MGLSIQKYRMPVLIRSRKVNIGKRLRPEGLVNGKCGNYFIK